MNRRGFIGLFAAVIAIPVAVVSGRRKIGIDWGRGSDRTIYRYNLPALKAMWRDGAPIGEWCDCGNKLYLQKEDEAFKAFISYCPFHGFYTGCCACDLNQVGTELCNRDHQLAPMVYKRMWAKYGKPIPTKISLAEAGIISARAYGIK